MLNFSKSLPSILVLTLSIVSKPSGYIIFITLLPRGNIGYKIIPFNSAGLLNNGIMSNSIWGYTGKYRPLEGSKAKNPWSRRPLGCLALELPMDNIPQDTPSTFSTYFLNHNNIHSYFTCPHLPFSHILTISQSLGVININQEQLR